MELSRRGFLGAMLGALVAEAIPFNRVWFIPNTVKPVNGIKQISGIKFHEDAKHYSVDVAFKESDLVLNIDDFSARFLLPAMKNIAEDIDKSALFAFQGAKIGQTLHIRKPQRFKDNRSFEAQIEQAGHTMQIAMDRISAPFAAE
jgi:hypothetical protein